MPLSNEFSDSRLSYLQDAIKNTEIDPTIEQYLLDTYRFMTYVAFEADCYNVTANKIDYYCLLQVKYIF